MARSFSQSASAAVGGDLGWIKPGQLGGQLDAVLAKMKPGEVSQPIRTPSGFHILMLRAMRAAPGLRSQEVTVSLHQLLLPLPAAASPADEAAQIDAARAMSAPAKNCDELDALGQKTGSAMSGSLGKVRLKQLPAALRSVVEGLAIGKPSRPRCP